MIYKAKLGDHLFNTFLYIFLTIAGIITLYPFLNVLAISLNDAQDTVRGGIYILPRVFTIKNYAQVFNYPDLSNSFIVSVARTVVGTAVVVFSSSMLAFVLSRKDFSARKILGMMFVLTMYVDGGLVPNFLLIKSLHLYNNFLVYILPSLVGVFYLLIIRTYITSLGMELQESAQIDGANDIIIFFRIIFPLCAPVIATVALYGAVSQWNSWFDTYLYTDGSKWNSTLQFQLVRILQNTTVSASTTNVDKTTAPKINPEAIRMTITVIATIPIVIVYPFLQKYFVKGMMIGAVKS